MDASPGLPAVIRDPSPSTAAAPSGSGTSAPSKKRRPAPPSLPRPRLPHRRAARRAPARPPLGAADGDVLFALPDVTVLAVRDLHDPHPSELSARSGDELPEVRVEQLFSELWLKKHSEAPDDATLEELRSALLALGREDEPALGGAA